MLKSDFVRELEEREKRKLNLIVYDLPESKEGNAHSRPDADMTLLKDTIETEIEKEIEIIEAVRLGKIFENGKPRPIRILLQSKEDMELLLNKVKSLKTPVIRLQKLQGTSRVQDRSNAMSKKNLEKTCHRKKGKESTVPNKGGERKMADKEPEGCSVASPQLKSRNSKEQELVSVNTESFSKNCIPTQREYFTKIGSVSTNAKKFGLNCLYYNTDSLTNKRTELETFIINHCPHIVFITETLPKNANYGISKAEWEVSGDQVLGDQ